MKMTTDEEDAQKNDQHFCLRVQCIQMHDIHISFSSHPLNPVHAKSVHLTRHLNGDMARLPLNSC